MKLLQLISLVASMAAMVASAPVTYSTGGGSITSGATPNLSTQASRRGDDTTAGDTAPAKRSPLEAADDAWDFLTLSETSGEDDMEPPGKRVGAESAPSSTSSKPHYDISKLVQVVYNKCYATYELYIRTEALMRDIFRKKIEFTTAVKEELRGNLATMAANSLAIAEELERTISGMAALAQPSGSLYDQITPDDVDELYYRASSINVLSYRLQEVITDKQGATHIRRFLWKFASREIRQGQVNARRIRKPLLQLIPIIKGSPMVKGIYQDTINIMLEVTANDGQLLKYVNWPPPPAAPQVSSSSSSSSISAVQDATEPVGAAQNTTLAPVLTLRDLEEYVSAAGNVYYYNFGKLHKKVLSSANIVQKNVATGRKKLRQLARKDIELTPAVEADLASYTARIAAQILNVASTLERAVADIDALAPEGTPTYNTITRYQAKVLFSMQELLKRIVADAGAYLLAPNKADPQGHHTLIKPVLWKISPAVISQSQDSARRWIVSLERLAEMSRASGTTVEYVNAADWLSNLGTVTVPTYLALHPVTQ